MNQCHIYTENPAFLAKVQLTEERRMVIESKRGRWRRKMFLLLLLVAMVPSVATLDTNANTDWTGDFSPVIIYLHCDYILSFFSLPEIHTQIHVCTLTTDNTEPSPLRSSEASFIPSLSSMHKNCWSYLDIFRALQPVLSCLREPLLPPHKSCCGSLCSIR